MLNEIFTSPVIDKGSYGYETNLAETANRIFAKCGAIDLRVGYGAKVFYQVCSDSDEVEVPHEALPKKLATFIKKNSQKPRGVCGFHMTVKPESVECWNDDHNVYFKNKI